jgi:hypothetical protein
MMAVMSLTKKMRVRNMAYSFSIHEETWQVTEQPKVAKRVMTIVVTMNTKEDINCLPT